MFVVNHFWRADQFKYQCQMAQLVDHLTRDSGGPVFESRSGQSLFLPSRYTFIHSSTSLIIQRQIPETYRCKSIQRIYYFAIHHL